MQTTRRAWRTPKAGRLNTLKLVHESLGPLAPDQVRIAVRAVGLNFADLFALTGLYSATPNGSFVPGLECAGVITQVGKDVTELAVGADVMAIIRFGAYTDTVDLPAAQCKPLPEGWDHAQGAAYLVTTFTAWYALKHLGAIEAGRTVLVHSAAGGVGLQAMRLCRLLGAQPIGTVSTVAKQSYLATQGFDRVVVRDDHFSKNLQKVLNSAPLHLALDAIGGKIQQQTFAALAPTGRLVVFGAAEFTPGRNRPNYLKALLQYLRRPRYDVLKMISSNRSVMAFNLIWLWQDLPLFETMLAELDALELPPPLVGHRFAFENAHEALQTLRSGRTMGKVVLTLPGADGTLQA